MDALNARLTLWHALCKLRATSMDSAYANGVNIA